MFLTRSHERDVIFINYGSIMDVFLLFKLYAYNSFQNVGIKVDPSGFLIALNVSVNQTKPPVVIE